MGFTPSLVKKTAPISLDSTSVIDDTF
jgi:hypothetical protein